MKNLGPAASAAADITTKSDVDAEITAAAGTGLTSPSSGSLAVAADYRAFPVTWYIGGTITGGTKDPVFIAPVACTVVKMLGMTASGTTCTYLPIKNGGAAGGGSDGTTSAATGTTPVTTTQSLALAAGDRLQLKVSVAAGTNLSVTMWVQVS